MARPLRIEYSGAVYHVTSRGNARKKIFKDDIDKDNFLETLSIVVTPEEWKWSSYSATVGIKKTPHYLTVDWILGQFGSIRRKAEKQYEEFVLSGIKEESPWNNLKGQILLGEEGFTEKFKDLLAQKEEIKEIPRMQRYATRPTIVDVFKGKILDKQTRNKQMYK